MSRNCISAGKLLPFAAAIAVAVTVAPVPAANSVQERVGVTQKMIPAGPQEVMQTFQSRMEPTAVQMRETTNPVTGERERIVEPIIMERHDRLLETRISQPVVLETEKTKSSLSSSTSARSMARRSFRSSWIAHRRAARPHGIAYRVARSGYGTVSSTSQQEVQTSEITREPMVRQTIIRGGIDLPPEAPQVIQKMESGL